MRLVPEGRSGAPVTRTDHQNFHQDFLAAGSFPAR